MRKETFRYIITLERVMIMSEIFFSIEIFGSRLKYLMEEFNLTTYSLAEAVFLTPATISRYMNAKMEPKRSTIEVLAKYFKVNPAWLMGTEGAERYLEVKIGCKKIPVVGTIAAGQPILAQEHIEGFEYVPENINVDFCLRVKGDSMINARILDGDLVYIRQQPDIENGEIAAVLIDQQNATLKRVYKLDSSVILRAENPSYQDLIFTKKEAKTIQILGKAIFFKSEVK